ncbi:protein D2-like [Musca domestica]|uniref:Protein D2-like n=1 Tax=Musca domestica TaxID=7370 RepID=A0A1I8MKL5_MUSDO|nr:protein D2-like [Musca domestica]
MSESTELENCFKKNQIIPDVVTVGPKSLLKIAYQGNLQVDKGNELTPSQVKEPPTLEWPNEDATYYTLIMTDPDAPSRKNPTFREYQHWLVANIPGGAVEKGDVLTAYIGSGPPKGTGLHRYVFLVFKQNGKVKFNEEHIPKNKGSSRGKFNTMQFVKKYKLAELVAGNFYVAKWDEYVPQVHKQLSGK